MSAPCNQETAWYKNWSIAILWFGKSSNRHVDLIFTKAPQESDQMVGIEEIALEDAGDGNLETELLLI
ncbi:MAG: hypothetical protein LBS96_02715, partial [Oscillospiraceae bacterium]|nr:hypothetical protein [Oscillospiraceae bacterium]